MNTSTVNRDVRLASGALLGLAAVWPLLPAHPPLVCPLRSTTGIPCPFCGLTRACVALAHGHVLRSLAFNPAGVLVIALAVTLAVQPSLVHNLRPRLWMLWAGLAALWVWNIGFNPTFHQLLLR